MKEIEKLRPFTRFLMTIGELPSSYLVSMTYEEQLLWFCNYLEKTVIPTVNNNAEAVIELQNFVANYFDNLNVQEEINNKLDEMVESGELEEILAEYLDSKIERNAIYIGNSFSLGIGSTDNETGLFKLTKDLYDNAYLYYTSGGGFVAYDNQHFTTFVTLLQNAIESTQFDNSSITDINFICAAGEGRAYGLLGESTYITNLSNSLSSIKTLVKNNFPNIKRVNIINSETRPNYDYNSYNSYYNDLFSIHQILKERSTYNDMYYCGWIGWSILLSDRFADSVHPNDSGYKILAQNMKNGLCGNLEYKTIKETHYINVSSIEGLRLACSLNINPEYCKFNIHHANLNAVPSTAPTITELTYNDITSAFTFIPFVKTTTNDTDDNSYKNSSLNNFFTFLYGSETSESAIKIRVLYKWYSNCNNTFGLKLKLMNISSIPENKPSNASTYTEVYPSSLLG